MSGGWCTIESDPGVFTELLETYGVRGVQCEELWSLEDEDRLRNLKPIYGIIFLFKVKEGKREDRSVAAPHVYFAKQMISNACATQALLNIVLNCADKIVLGDELSNFLEFTRDLDPETRGHTIGSSDVMRNCHNSFARNQNFTFEEKFATEDDDVFHFIGYLPKDGFVYELDGLQNGPILVGEYVDDWISTVRQAVQTRIAEYASTEIRFNLLALCKNPLDELREELTQLQGSGRGQDDPRILVLKDRIDAIVSTRRQWKVENQRRRHNYIPFIVKLLQCLSERGALAPLITKGKEKTKADEQRAQQDKAKKTN
eukprot:TRINITY_DN3382_c0_g1_i1.p2 TRINITY_DN3382_c0_g1~~TRINITY_DN3382_c0_g1_i1.p2  ORF type:complete len:315 (+),score=55.01 TRINITY_DN3382_c0_g1_i1:1240-2184(+)